MQMPFAVLFQTTVTQDPLFHQVAEALNVAAPRTTVVTALPQKALTVSLIR